MAPKRGPKKKTTPKSTRSTRGNPNPEIEVEIPVPPPPRTNQRNAAPAEEIPVIPTPPIQMDPMQLQAFMTALVAYETARGETSGVNGSRDGTPVSRRNNSTTCTYKDFMLCKPRNFYGNEGVIGFNRWVEKMESVFSLCSCPDESRVKFAACTLADAALTWWNDHVESMGINVANALEWRIFKQMLIEEYCPRPEIQNLEQELWNLKMKGSEVSAYTSRFNDLARLCPRMVDPEYIKIEKYISGLSSPVQGLVTASRPTTFDSAKQLAYRLTDQCIKQGTMTPQAERKPEGSKRRFDGKEREDPKHQKPHHESVTVDAAITNTPAPSNSYAGNAPSCIKCNRHHYGECLVCTHCNTKGHTVKYCRKLAAAIAPPPATGGSRNCYECNQTGHFRRDCPKLKNQGGRGRAFVIGRGEAQQTPHVGADTLEDYLN